MIYQFKIQLKNITKPPVWRQVQVPENLTFHQFHRLIQIVFGWENCHLYQFTPSGYGSRPVIAIPMKDDWEKPDLDAKKTTLPGIFTAEKQTFNYLYDFGDDWAHQILLEKILPGEIKEPLYLAGKGACPPEDCGGPWGYENIKTILTDPKHEEHQEMRDWLGIEDNEYFDPNFFDPDVINKKLKKFNRAAIETS